MKKNLKKKIMLAVLAGGMLCANGAWAEEPYWYGSGSPAVWKGVYVATFAPDDACTTGANLLVVDNQTFDSITLEGTWYIYGGYSNTPDVDVSDNQITFNVSSATIQADIYAGYIGNTGPGTVSGNKLIIGKPGDTAGGTFKFSLNGGYNNGTGDAKNNSVTVYNGTFSNPSGSYIRGGYSNYGNVADNCVTIDNGTFSANIYGGLSYRSGGAATGNSVTANGGTFNCEIYGGYSYNGAVTSNSVTVNGGTFSKGICGGYDIGTGDAKNNSVTIYNGTFSPYSYSHIYGGYSEKRNVTENCVTIKNGTFNYEIYGGYSYNGSGAVTSNSVTVDGGTFSRLINGGYSSSGSGAVTGNSVTVNGGTFKDSIYGGFTRGSGDATSNSVTINGGTFINKNYIYGGSSPSGTAKDNSITINGGTFNNGFTLRCGAGNSNNSGNTLNLNIVIGGKAQEVARFQKMNFTIPVGMDREMPMLNVTNPVSLGGITFTTDLNDLSLASGEYITLVKGVQGDGGTFTDPGKYYVLTIGDTKELVYSNGTPVAKGDYTIIQGSKKWDAPAVNGTYSSAIQGNTTDGGLSATSYSNNEIIIRRGTYSGVVYGAYSGDSNNVTGNKVSVYDGTFSGQLYGGYSSSGTAGGDTPEKGNKVIINNGTFNNGTEIYGGYSAGGNAKNNSVTINNGTFSNLIYGGFSNNGNVTDNGVTIDCGTFNNGTKIYGGYSENSGDAKGNSVTINNGIFSNLIYGGYSSSGIAGGDTPEKGNKVIINNGTFNNGTKIYGGYSNGSGAATGNSVTIKNGIFNCDIWGGYSGNGNATENFMTIDGGTFSTNVFGGYSNGSGAATDNYVTINGGIFSSIFGGSTDEGDVINNFLTIEGGTFNGGIFGGYSGVSGAATGNSITINGGTFNNGTEIYGGYSNGSGAATGNSVTIKNGIFNCDIWGGYSGNGNATENFMTIDGGTFSNWIYGGYSNGSGAATGNFITINGGTFSTNVFGGYSNGSGAATDNYVTINGGIFSSIFGGSTDEGDVIKNFLTIEGGTFNGGIFGGYSGVSGAATGNSITINGGTFNNGTEIYGGFSWSGTAKDNFITINGGTFNNGFVLCGGDGDSNDSGNTLNLNIVIGGKANEVKKFQKMNFTIPVGITADDKMLSVTNAVSLNDVTLKVYLNGYAGEDTITLIDNVTGTLGTANVYTGTVDNSELTDDYAVVINNSVLYLKETELWYTVGGKDKKFLDEAGAQEITSTVATGDVVIKRGTKTGNNYNAIDVGTHTLTIDLNTITKEMTANGNVTAGSVVISADNTLNVASGKTLTATSGVTNNGVLTIGAGDLKSAVTNAAGATVNLGGGTLASGKTITGGTLNIKGDISANAGDIASNNNTVDDGKTLTLNAGTLNKAIGGAGNVAIGGNVTSSAANFTNSGTLSVVAGNTLTLTDSTLGGAVTGEGTLKIIDNTVIANASYIGAKTNTVDENANLTLIGTNVTLNKAIDGAGEIDIGDAGNVASVTSTFDKFKNTGSLKVAANSTLLTSGNINRVVSGTGTVQLTGDTVLTNGKSIAGTLKGNGQKVTLGSGTANTIDTFTVGTLTDTLNLVLDVDMSNFTSDKLTVTTLDGSVIVDSINIVKDITPSTLELSKEEDNKIIYLTKTAGTGTTSVKDSTITVTNNYKYTFTAGTETGKLDYKVEATNLTFKKFMEGTLPDYTTQPTTLSLTADLVNTGDGSTAIAQAGDRTINLNGHTLSSSAASTITVGSGKTLVLNGGSDTAGTVDANTNFSVAGIMNVAGKTDIKGAITNTGTVTFADTTVVEGILSGAGSYTNSGTMTVADASKLAMTNGLANSSGTLNLGGGTLGVKINGGNIVLNGDVSANADYLAGAVINASNTLTLSGGNSGTPVALGGNISGTGAIIVNGVIFNANAIENAVTVNSGKQLTNTGTISGAVTNNGTFMTTANGITGGVTNNSALTLTDGDLGSAVSGTGNAVVGGSVANSGKNTISQNALTINAGAGLTTEVDALVINNNTGPITNNGTLTLTADGTTPDTLEETVSGSGRVVFGDGINTMTIIAGSSIANAMEVKANATLAISAVNVDGAVTNNGIVKLGAGTLEETITGGNIQVDGAVTSSANNLQGAIQVNDSKNLYLTAGTLGYAVTGDGWVNVSTTGDNEVIIAANVNKLKNQGKMKVSGAPVTFKNVEFAAGSTLTLNASDCTASAPINIAAGGSITVDSTAVLCVKGAEKKTVYKIVSGVDGSFLDSDWDLSHIVGEGLKVSDVGVVGDVYQITFKSCVPENTMLKNLLADGSDNKLMDWAEGVTDKYGDNETMAVNEINAMAALGENLGVTRGALDVTKMVGTAVADHLNDKQLGYEDEDSDAYSVSGNAWARLTHNRVKVDGLHTGDMNAKYSAQYNGISVGYDMLDAQDITVGVALHYADGNVTNGFGGHNDSTYTGISIYAQKLMNQIVVSGDMTYLHGKNEMDQAGVTANAKTNTVSVGFDARRPIKVGKGYVTPFTGMRYNHVANGGYTDSLGINRSSGSVSNFVTPLGARYSVNINEFYGWTLQPFAEIGYLFSFGDKGSDMKLRYGTAEDTFGFDVVDRNTFFTRAGMNFSKKNLTAGVGYDYMKSSNSNNNKWNINCTWSF